VVPGADERLGEGTARLALTSGVRTRPFVSLLLAGAALLAGLVGSLVLLGYQLGPAAGRLAASHGQLMILGFLGTLIALERAVALARPWGYLAPLAAGLGAATLIAGLSTLLGAALVTIGAIVYVGMYLAFLSVDRARHTVVQAIGAVGWLAAALLLLAGRPAASAVPWLSAFLVLTIAGERLEMSRLAQQSERARRAFVGAAVLFGGGVVVSLGAEDLGVRVAGAGMVALAAWLARYDLARRTVRMRGVTRFMAVALLVSYAWLAVAGACWLAFGASPSTAARDVMLHALYLGFVISMVFGHAPVILPAVLRIELPYHPRFYAHLGLLHVGLLVRVVGGDVLGSNAAWQVGGVLNVLAVLLFAVSSAAASVGAYRGRRRSLGGAGTVG
jgi:hypothetical protein